MEVVVFQTQVFCFQTQVQTQYNPLKPLFAKFTPLYFVVVGSYPTV